MQLIPEIQPDLIFTDIVMPNMNGLELIEQVKQLYPSIRIIVLSSHNDYEYELLILLQESADRIKVNQWAEGSDTPPKDEIKTELFRLLIQEKPTDAAELWAQAHQLFHPQLTQQIRKQSAVESKAGKHDRAADAQMGGRPGDPAAAA
ncbi:unnamed protein product [Aphanomyces euteiches]